MTSRKNFILFIVIFSTFVAADAQADKKAIVVVPMKRDRQFNPKFVGKTEQELETVEHKLSDAFATYDIKALADVLSDDLDIMGLLSPDGKTVKTIIIDLAMQSQKF